MRRYVSQSVDRGLENSGEPSLHRFSEARPFRTVRDQYYDQGKQKKVKTKGLADGDYASFLASQGQRGAAPPNGNAAHNPFQSYASSKSASKVNGEGRKGSQVKGGVPVRKAHVRSSSR
jgi:hypothetical protein